MKRFWFTPAAVIALISTSGAVHACRINAKLVHDDVRYADTVVLGRVGNYHIVRDVEFRRKMLSNPKLTPRDRKIYEGSVSLMPDYARFDIQVDTVLKGAAPATLSVTWSNSTFGIPDALPAGPLLIALQKPNSVVPPLRGPSATIQPSREPSLMTVLQAPCSAPFMFESDSNDARVILGILARSNP